MSKWTNSHGLLLGCALVVPITSEAQAQGAPQGNREASDVEEIIVTAQRRDESIQDVPIAVSVLSSDALDDARISSTRDLEKAVAGLEMKGTQGSTTPHIRGIGSSFSGQGDENAVSLYIDGVYQVASLGNIFGLSNVERVEVLKGPQGTLFGRNATGGVVQIVTRDPPTSPTFEASLGYGNFDTKEVKAYAGGSLSDKLSLDMSVYYFDQGKGWGRNISTGAPAYRNEELTVRSKLLLDLDATRITLSGGYTRLEDSKNVGGYIVGINLDGSPPLASIYDQQGLFPNFSRVRKGDVNLRVEHDTGGVQLVSISSWQKVRAHDSLDQDATPLPIIGFDTHSPVESFVQEVQLLSPEDSRIGWILGAFYLSSNADYDPTDIIGFGVAPITPFLRLTNHFTTESVAVFGQADIPLVENTNLTLGLRYTSDTQTEQGSNAAGTLPPFFSSQKIKETFSKPSWRVALSHDFSPTLMAYASYNRGFKSGVFSATSVGAPPVRPEILDAYQLGVKAELLDRRLRLNLEGYYYDYQDIQVVKVVVGGSGFVNAASAKIKGFDLDAQLNLSKSLSLNGTLAYNDGRYKQYPGATCTLPSGFGGNISFICDASGRKMGFAAPWSASIGGRYAANLGGGGSLTFAGNYYYRQGYRTGIDQRVRSSTYNLLSASVTWADASDRFSLRLWADNLLDKQYFRSAGSGDFYDFAQPGAPRTYGATLGVKFGG